MSHGRRCPPPGARLHPLTGRNRSASPRCPRGVAGVETASWPCPPGPPRRPTRPPVPGRPLTSHAGPGGSGARGRRPTASIVVEDNSGGRRRCAAPAWTWTDGHSPGPCRALDPRRWPCCPCGWDDPVGAILRLGLLNLQLGPLHVLRTYGRPRMGRDTAMGRLQLPVVLRRRSHHARVRQRASANPRLGGTHGSTPGAVRCAPQTGAGLSRLLACIAVASA